MTPRRGACAGGRPNALAGDLSRTETIGDLTTVNRKTSTVKTEIDVELDTLTTWNNIPEIGKAVSGTGRYEATFEWDADSASGAYLDFGATLESSMKVWINGEKVGGQVSTNPTKVKQDVGGVDKPTIDDGRGNQIPLVGKEQFTGGVSWTKPVADVSEYLVDGENTIVIEYASVLANVQLDRGIVTEQFPRIGRRDTRWWGNDIKYLEFGPRQAKVVPFVEVAYDASLLDVTPRMLGSKVHLSVSATNDDTVPVDVVITTAYGSKTFKNVKPGKSVAVSINSRSGAVPAGEATVSVTGSVGAESVTETKTVSYEAFPAS